MRALTVFFQFILTLCALILGLASGILLVTHRGPSTELAQALTLLAGCIALILVTEYRTTGRWGRWPRR